MQGRVLAIDPGGRRVGLALSDPLRIIASPFRTLLVEDDADAVRQLKEIIAKEEVSDVVVGVPMRSGGNQSEQAKRVLDFIDLMKRSIRIPIHQVDESYTSVEAEDALHAMGRRIGQDKGAVDRIAAALILKQYLRETQ